MNFTKDIIKQCDFFSHTQFLRYKKQQNFRTITGGIVSIILIIIFIGIFANLAYDTFHNRIISQSTQIFHDSNPIYYGLKTGPTNKFMFAIGITDMDFSVNKRYLDIKLQNYTVTKVGSGNVTTITSITLSSCSQNQWTGINGAIEGEFKQLNLTRWLCPPSDYEFPLEGKYTSNTFKYGKITVSSCSNSSSSIPCATPTQISNFISSTKSAVLNVYFVNPVINAGSVDYIQYYLQDGNYFNFNAVTGTTANLYFSNYQIITDQSIMPWSDPLIQTGGIATDLAGDRNLLVGEDAVYAKIYLRKSSLRYSINRSFQKLDQTLSYIGGLFGTAILLFVFLSIYDKYAYEIQFGDRIFKQNNNGSYGSQSFNFIVFLGYSIYNIFAKFSVNLSWQAMRKYHQCRMQSLKQLDIHLLFQKLSFFQQISKVVFEDHHLKGLHMIPKPVIKQAKKNRKRYIIKSIIYHQLERKARQICVQAEEYDKRYNAFLKMYQDVEKKQNIEEQSEDDMNQMVLSKTMSSNYKILQQSSKKGQIYSQKIINKLGIQNMCKIILDGLEMKKNNGQLIHTEGQFVSYPSIEQLVSSILKDEKEQKKEKDLKESIKRRS